MIDWFSYFGLTMMIVFMFMFVVIPIAFILANFLGWYFSDEQMDNRERRRKRESKST